MWINSCVNKANITTKHSPLCQTCIPTAVYSQLFKMSTNTQEEYYIMKQGIALAVHTQITKFMGPTWGPPGSCRPQMGPMLVPWTLLPGYLEHLGHICIPDMVLLCQYCNLPPRLCHLIVHYFHTINGHFIQVNNLLCWCEIVFLSWKPGLLHQYLAVWQ